MFHQQDAPLKITDAPMLGDAMLWTQPQPDLRRWWRRGWDGVVLTVRRLLRRLRG